MTNLTSNGVKKIIVGIDEAGRGPLAGPVIAAAITGLGNPKHEFRISKLRDSKLLSAIQRERIYLELYQNPDVFWGVGKVGEKTIDKINILQATRLAMKRAVSSLYKKIGVGEDGPSPAVELVIDGNMLLDLPIVQKAIIKADATIMQCMAASIIAKVTRDRLMLKLHKKYPLYGFNRHKGYGTPQHMEMLRLHGPSPVHRMSFAPCQKAVFRVK